MPPPNVDDVGLGFRVPMLVVSPYARKGYVDDAEGEFSSPLKFIEDNWGLPYLTPRIENTHNFEHVFAFERNPRDDTPKVPMIGECSGDPFTFPATTTRAGPPASIPPPERATFVAGP